ncbi:MAG: hypothetical protein ACXVAX_01035 [Pseudobdellovibrio sp.]
MSARYLAALIDGAQQAGLPQNYVDSLSSKAQ